MKPRSPPRSRLGPAEYFDAASANERTEITIDHDGQIVVARLGDEVTVKRFQRTAQGIELLPENADFQPIVVPPDSADFELEGLAVGLIRNQVLN